jgi:hypothetical protein
MIFLESRLSESIESQISVTRMIGDVLMLDELLTMSAHMYVASRNETYRDRYQQNVLVLERTLSDILDLAGNAEAISAVSQTDSANRVLVGLEEEAFRLAALGKWEEASSVLHSDAYLQHKELYTIGMKGAFGVVRENMDQNSLVLRWSLWGVAVALLVSILILMRFWQQVQLDLFELKSSQAKLEALQVTMRTVMDTFNNALNNLQLFRLQAEESGHFSEKDLALFDSVIKDSASRLSAMGSMQEFRVRDGGEFPALDYEKGGRVS